MGGAYKVPNLHVSLTRCSREGRSSPRRPGWDVRDQIEGNFKVQFRHGLEALQDQRCLQQLDACVRRASGLMVAGEPTAGLGEEKRRHVVFDEKTAAEKAKSKGKGKGQGQDGAAPFAHDQGNGKARLRAAGRESAAREGAAKVSPSRGRERPLRWSA